MRAAGQTRSLDGPAGRTHRARHLPEPEWQYRAPTPALALADGTTTVGFISGTPVNTLRSTRRKKPRRRERRDFATPSPSQGEHARPSGRLSVLCATVRVGLVSGPAGRRQASSPQVPMTQMSDQRAGAGSPETKSGQRCANCDPVNEGDGKNSRSSPGNPRTVKATRVSA